ncbi:MAG TPA: hypothetical protein VFI52_10265 [Gemmatimonadaceae bacterium]|nr:hypothetical protein [Gemmatimonadaceae bacterium]
MAHLSARPTFVALVATLTLLATPACRPNKPSLGELPGSARTRDSLMGLPPRRTATARETVEKRVDAKRAMNTLVAGDNSWCTVSDEQFAQTRIGDSVRCAWVPSSGR